MTFGIFLAFNGMSGLMLGATFNELHRWDRRPVFPPNFSVCRFRMISVSYEQQKKCIRLIPRILGHLYCQISTGQGPKTVPLEEQHGRRGLQKSRCGLEQTCQSAPSWNHSSSQGIPPRGWHPVPHWRGLLVLMFVRFSAKQSQTGQELMVQTWRCRGKCQWSLLLEQQQELLVFRVLGGIQTATNHRHVLNRNLRPKQHLRHCSSFPLELG